MSAQAKRRSVPDESTRRLRRYRAMLAAWPRRTPRLLTAPSQPMRGTMMKMSTLPDDILLLIFTNFTAARDIQTFRNVCQSWRALIDRSATIWRRLVFHLPACPSSAPEAETWYRKAADYGNTQAQFLLALLYTYGYAPGRRPAATSFSRTM